jgi:phage replication O-like protein O
MTNNVQIINFPKSKRETSEQESPFVKADIENGFVRVANELNLALCKTQLSDRESRLFHAIMHKTYGFNKKLDWVCYEQLAEMTNIDVTNIGKTKARLLARNMIFAEGKKVGINPVVSEWLDKPKTQKKSKPTQKKISQNRLKKKSELTYGKVGTDSDLSRNRLIQKKDTNTKDTIQKTKAHAPVFPSCIPGELWTEFLQMRKAIKKPMTEQASKRMIAKLDKLASQGINVTECVETSIINSWSDVYPPKNTKHRNSINGSAHTITAPGYQINTTIPGFEEAMAEGKL